MDKTMNQTIWQHRGLPILILAYASMVDWAMTVDALSIGHLEANPIMARLSPMGMLLGKLASLAVVILCARGLDKVKPSWTLPALWATVAAQCAVVLWNVIVVALAGGAL